MSDAGNPSESRARVLHVSGRTAKNPASRGLPKIDFIAIEDSKGVPAESLCSVIVTSPHGRLEVVSGHLGHLNERGVSMFVVLCKVRWFCARDVGLFELSLHPVPGYGFTVDS